MKLGRKHLPHSGAINSAAEGSWSSPSWRNWVMTLLGTLVVIGVTGLISMYVNQSVMKEHVDDLERRIANLEGSMWRHHPETRPQ